ncbi:MAG: T9SS type A sorting domain-containing protein [Bacteroidota bacterium]
MVGQFGGVLLLFVGLAGSLQAQEARVLQAEAGPSGARAELVLEAATAKAGAGAVRALTLRTYDAKGRPRVTHALTLARDVPFPVFRATEAGALAYGLPATGAFTLLSADGQVRAQRTLFREAAYDEERTLLVASTPTGTLTAVAALRSAARPRHPQADGNAVLFLFDASGTLRAERPVRYPAVEALAMAPDGRTVLVSSYDAYAPDGMASATEAFDAQGVVQWSAPYGFERATFDGGTVTLHRTEVAVPHRLDTGQALDASDGLGLPAAPVHPAATSTRYPWPLKPFNESQRITGTFSEYRGPNNPHFHDAVDIPQADGTPVYPVANGRVTSLDPSGSNAFVRVENFAYVHIRPRAGLSVGDAVVAGQTVLGTIVNGQGHVHFKDGYVGSQRNAIRADGGLVPFEDPWAPVISDVRFYLQPTRQRLATSQLTGPVEITFRVEERNAPPGTSGAGRNNGAYIVGYKVLSRDRTTEVFVPGPDGVQFQFDGMPSNSRVHNVFDRLQASTSRHVYLATSSVSRRTALDTEALPEGDYTVLLFAEDTRGNRAETFVDVTVIREDLIPPPPPLLLAAGSSGPLTLLRWANTTTPDLAGYRLFGSTDRRTFDLRLGEEALPLASSSTTFDAPAEATYYYLTAIDGAAVPNVSDRSDVYGVAVDPQARQLLIVDGFDRTQASGSWQTPWHDFAARHGQALDATGYGFFTVANDFVQGTLLSAYDAVIWALGDESTADETFDASEQARVRAYLQAGGRLLVSGSEIGWDLDARGEAADRRFLHEVLKTRYAGDDAESYQVEGLAGTPFDGLTFAYGSAPYVEDWPDYFTPGEGAEACLRYANGRIAAVCYDGLVEGGTAPARLIVLGFPFETITGDAVQAEVMARAMTFLLGDRATSTHHEADLPTALHVDAPYPNPSRGSVRFAFTLPEASSVRLTEYDLIGREVAVVADAPLGPGAHTLDWAAEGLAGGVYLYRLVTPQGTHTGRLVRVR